MIDDFTDLLNEDGKDALLVTIYALKRKMASQFKAIEQVDVDIIMKCMKDPSCLFLRQQLQMDTFQEMDPEAEIPMG